MQATSTMATSMPERREEILVCERQIARLTAQLQYDNQAIARLIEARQRLRRRLIAAQERKLRALRDDCGSNASAADEPSLPARLEA